MAECKKCKDWICKAQDRNHEGMCVEHAPLRGFPKERSKVWQ